MINITKKHRTRNILIIIGVIAFIGFLGQQLEDEKTDSHRFSEDNLHETKNLRKYINGINPASIYEPLREKGFIIDKQFGELFFVNCNKNEEGNQLTVRISAEGSKVIEVRAGFTNYSNLKTSEISKQFLGFISSLPYENSKPDEVRKWVEDNLEKGGRVKVGGVNFEIFTKSKNMRTLIITPE